MGVMSIPKLVSEIGDDIERTYPVIKSGPEGPSIEGPDRRISWGVTKRDGDRVVALLVERDDSWALRRGKEFAGDHPGSVVVRVTGTAQSAHPVSPRRVRREEKLVPGLSVSHYAGFAGTIGCLVQVGRGRNAYRGLVSASHVLSVNNTANKGDQVVHPAKRDTRAAMLSHVVGTVEDYSLLAHYLSQGQDPFNTQDVAIARITDDERACENHVPDPEDPGKRTIPLAGVVESDEIHKLIAQPVYKIGRTSGFTAGVMEVADVKRFPVRLPNGKIYLWQDVALVRGESGKAFSEAGDSGSVVYTSSGAAVGLVIGGSDEFTVISPLSICLEAIEADLL
jgi:hypothetical protein